MASQALNRAKIEAIKAVMRYSNVNTNELRRMETKILTTLLEFKIMDFYIEDSLNQLSSWTHVSNEEKMELYNDGLDLMNLYKSLKNMCIEIMSESNTPEMEMLLILEEHSEALIEELSKNKKGDFRQLITKSIKQIIGKLIAEIWEKKQKFTHRV